MTDNIQSNFTQTQQTPLVVNNSDSSGIETYRTKISPSTLFLLKCYITVGLILCIFSIFMPNPIDFIFLTFGAIVFFSLITGCFLLYHTITIDKEKGIITFKKFNTCICCQKKKICTIKDIKGIYSEMGTSSYKVNNVNYNSYNIVVELANGNKIRVIEEEMDYGYRKEGVLNFLSKSFPTLVRVNDFPVNATNTGNMEQPQNYQGQQPNYLQPQIQNQPQYPVSQNIMINNAEPVQQYANPNELNNQMVINPEENNGAPPLA